MLLEKSRILLGKILRLITFLTISLFMIISCDSTEPGKETLSLNLEEVSCTEVWLKVVGEVSEEFILKRDNQEVDRITLTEKNNIIYDDSLQPNTNYTYQVSSIQNQTSSNEVTATTMDTTSHNFTWQSFTFGGQGGSSALYDVAIIDENNIWAVGEIFTTDDKYNAVHWDGSEWELKKIMWDNSLSTLSCILAFSADDIWFGITNLIHWNGKSYEKNWNTELKHYSDKTISKIWGTSSSDLYVAGSEGKIIHYDGSSWTKIESGTATRINDVWGIINSHSQTILYCPVSSFFVQGDRTVLKIVDGSVNFLEWNYDARLYSTWAMSENILYVCGEGVFVNKYGQWDEIPLLQISTNSIRGNNLNDIFVAGDYGLIYHFNGSNWQLLNSINSSKGYSKVSTLENLVVVCGNQQGQGLIEIGIRNY